MLKFILVVRKMWIRTTKYIIWYVTNEQKFKPDNTKCSVDKLVPSKWKQFLCSDSHNFSFDNCNSFINALCTSILAHHVYSLLPSELSFPYAIIFLLTQLHHGYPPPKGSYATLYGVQGSPQRYSQDNINSGAKYSAHIKDYVLIPGNVAALLAGLGGSWRYGY